MIYAEIIYIEENKEGQDKIHFELYNAPSEMIDAYINFKKERKN